MGEVHRARHIKLRREVAIKVLPAALAADPSLVARFEREARAASALNHRNIVTIYDIAEQDGITYIAMELVEGRTLRSLIADGPLPVDEVVRLARQIVDGLAKAHESGIVHRDIKPENIVVTPEGVPKILDFGLAKPLPMADRESLLGRSVTATQEGMVVGTPHYMSPEQFSGGDVDHRSDQFSFGVTLYEMICGQPPFVGDSVGAILSAILAEPPPPLKSLRPDAPAALERIIARCLGKQADQRFDTTAALGAALREYERRQTRVIRRVARSVKRPVIAVPIVGAMLALVAVGWLWLRGADRRWAQHEAPGEIQALIDAGDLFGAYRTALEAARYVPADPELDRLFERITMPLTVNTEPLGAEVSVRSYGHPDSPWISMGVTPVSLRVPYELVHWRIEKSGYEPFEGAPFGGGSLVILRQGLVLDSAGARPAGTVRVAGGPPTGMGPVRSAQSLDGVELEPYYLDRYEVTNRQFKEFVDAGGYTTREWWSDAMTRAGRAIGWEEAMEAFRDPTGRPGPSTWELGDFARGRGEYPVTGISWFEAAAYCAFAGRSLPTIYHWFGAIGQEQRSDILTYSNIDGDSLAPVGSFEGLSAYGAYDMAGNAKEWVWNATGDKRYILGGAWNEPRYLFKDLVAEDPWGREATNGVRCVQYVTPPSDALLAPADPVREYPQPEPISDEAFELLRGVYAYDPSPLDARVERVNDNLLGCRQETVSIETGYRTERMEIHLLIPRGVAPPYQSVVWFPGADVFSHRSSDDFASAWLFDFLPRAGRVVVYPVYRGMYERFEPFRRTPNDTRRMMISWRQDIGRTIDYLETREDFDATKIAYYGFSLGAWIAPVFAAVEPRLATAILLGGGLIPTELDPAMFPAYFSPRTKTPMLMINGRDDFIFPYEAAQRPFFDLLGAPDSLKRQARLAGGHIPTDTRDIIREVLDWLDARFGPVRRRGVIVRATTER